MRPQPGPAALSSALVLARRFLHLCRFGAPIAGAVALSLASIAPPSPAQSIRDDLYVTNGVVTSIVRYGNTLYLGGGFSRVAPATGCGVPIDKTSALAESGFPKIAGNVYAVVSDEAGGWYIGGDFRAVGGVPRAHLAHVLGDHTLASWNPSPDGTVTRLAFGGGAVFVAGSFNLIGSASRHVLAALDATTGDATGWNPNPDGSSINALELMGSTPYVAGDFTTIGGQARAGLAALNATSGAATSWDPNPDNSVLALATSGSIIYAGGYFSNIGGAARNQLAALDAATGSATSWQWQPDFADGVSALAASGSTVYAGGYFNYTAGANVLSGLGAFDAVSGQPLAAWSCAGNVTALALDGGTLYVADFVNAVSGPDRFGVVALDAATGVPSSWDPQANGDVFALAVDGTHVFAGGDFASLGGVPRTSLAALDLATGQPTSWSPVVNGYILKLGLIGSTLYAAGKFDFPVAVPGDTAKIRRNLAAFDLTTGEPTSWDPNATTTTYRLPLQYISTMAVGGSAVYVGGRFNEIGGQIRNYLAAIDGTTGAVTDWNPSPNDSIATIAVNGDVVYVGGCFDKIGAQPRGGVAALSASAHDSTDGVTLAWDPKPFGPSIADPFPYPPWRPRFSFGPVRAIAVSGNTVYLGGQFDIMNGFPGGPFRWSIAGVDATTGIVTPFDAGILNPPTGGAMRYVSALAANGGAVYVSGSFEAISTPDRTNLMALDPATGAHLSWNPVLGQGQIVTFLIDGSTIYVGGGFNSIGNVAQAGIAAIEAVPAPTAVEESLTRGFSLVGARPNPAPGPVRVAFTLPDAEPARLELVDLVGRRVASHEVGALGAGSHVVILASGGALPAGLYWARLTRAGQSLTARVLVLR